MAWTLIHLAVFPTMTLPYLPASSQVSGMTQVLAKAMTQKAMIFGVPFFVATLVKNAKMVPVMLGAIVMSGKKYPLQKYLQVWNHSNMLS